MSDQERSEYALRRSLSEAAREIEEANSTLERLHERYPNRPFPRWARWRWERAMSRRERALSRIAQIEAPPELEFIRQVNQAPYVQLAGVQDIDGNLVCLRVYLAPDGRRFDIKGDSLRVSEGPADPKMVRGT